MNISNLVQTESILFSHIIVSYAAKSRFSCLCVASSSSFCLVRMSCNFRKETKLVIFTTQDGLGAAIAVLNRLVEEYFIAIDKDCPKISPQSFEKWSCLPIGFFKVHIDASFSSGKDVLALVVKDVDGQIVHLVSQPCSCNGSHEAEVRALDWASKQLEEKNYSKLIRSSYDLNLINEVKVVEDLHVLDTQLLMLHVLEIQQN